MEAGDPRVAVVMITWNRRPEVLRSLQHLTRLPERPRLVLVDNGSTDGTAAAVRERFPQVEVLDARRNIGAAARTLGVRHVDTPYVALCDDDTWWEPGSLRHSADLFDKHPRLAIVTGRVLVGEENEEDPACRDLADSRLPAEADMPGPPLLGFLGGASVIRQSAFLQVGGFEPRFFIGGEEELLATDLAARGWWLCYVAELTVHHHPSACREAGRRRWHIVRNALWSAWLRRPLTSAVRKTLWMARAAPWDGTTLRGFATAAAGLPWVLQHRRVVPDRVERGLRLLDPPGMGAVRTAPCSSTPKSAATACRKAPSA
jgi:GT2 family glycosyltransferase